MTPCIIAGIILAVGAGIELLAYIFACRMDKKRKEGLDSREAALNAKETERKAVQPLLNILSRHNLELTKVRSAKITVCEFGIFAEVEITAKNGGPDNAV